MAAEPRTGKINTIFDADTADLIEDGTGTVRDFYQKGAQVSFQPGDSVNYMLITFPNGKPPVVIEVKKPH